MGLDFLLLREGVVNLLIPLPVPGRKVGRRSLPCPLCCQCYARHFLASVKSLGHDLTVFAGGEEVAAWTEVLRDGAMVGS